MATRTQPPRVRRSPRTLLTSAVLILAVSACAPSPYSRRPSPKPDALKRQPTLVYVENKSFDDLTIYVVRNANLFRIGWVPGYTWRVLKVNSTIIGAGSDTRIVAQLPGEATPRHVTQLFDVQPGSSIHWVILERHDMSPATVEMRW